MKDSFDHNTAFAPRVLSDEARADVKNLAQKLGIDPEALSRFVSAQLEQKDRLAAYRAEEERIARERGLDPRHGNLPDIMAPVPHDSAARGARLSAKTLFDQDGTPIETFYRIIARQNVLANIYTMEDIIAAFERHHITVTERQFPDGTARYVATLENVSEGLSRTGFAAKTDGTHQVYTLHSAARVIGPRVAGDSTPAPAIK